MPHIVVKLCPGRSEAQKRQLAAEIVKDAVNLLNTPESSISVAFEEISLDEWAEKVFKPEILDKAETLYKKPGYNPYE